jgi:hypothetical protein
MGFFIATRVALRVNETVEVALRVALKNFP